MAGHDLRYATVAMRFELRTIFPWRFPEDLGDHFDAGVALYALRKKTASRILLKIFS
ncbi:MAG: hypothetical protein F2849_05370 [Actinobacteria bacterium]|nr:hypothetical protein [Actinomycetota bacterium]